jgi:hypothetical protein
VVDGDHRVTGMITRNDITQHTLHNHWVKEGDNMSKFVNIDAVMEPAQISQTSHHPPRDSSSMPVADGNESSSWFKDRHGSIEANASASPPHLNIHASENSYSSPTSPETRSERSAKSSKKTKSKEPKSYKSNT